MAMVYAIKHFSHYLYRRPFTVRTDHNALEWLQSFKHPEGQIARYLHSTTTRVNTTQEKPLSECENNSIGVACNMMLKIQVLAV